MKKYKPGELVWYDIHEENYFKPPMSPIQKGRFKWVHHELTGLVGVVLDAGLGRSIFVPENKIIEMPERETHMTMAKATQEGFKLGIEDWCKESNHVFEVGEFAKIIKEDSIFKGCIVKVVDTRYDPKQGHHRYWVVAWPDDKFPLEYEQDELELTNEKPKCWEEKKMENTEFTKKDLKSGMLIITKNGNHYILMELMCGGLYLVNMDKTLPCSIYKDDLTVYGNLDYTINGKPVTKNDDIAEVWSLPHDMKSMPDLFNNRAQAVSIFGQHFPNRDLLWKRSEAKEMSVADIEKALGYKIKVVK